MISDRIQRRIDALLDGADGAFAGRDWSRLRNIADDVLKLDPENVDALVYLDAAAKGEREATLEAEPSVGSEAGAALPASFVSGRYRVLRLLGEGGRKRVYLAHDERLDRDVAFAVIKTEGLDAMGRERVQREARAMARIGAHPNLVAIHDIGEEGGDPFLVQEYMDGGDLAVSHQPSAVSADLSVVRILEVAKGVAAGLAFIHRAGIVHRDLKPANVFLASDGTAKIGDFGLAMAADLTRITQHGTFVGTVAYMPPEQAVGGDVTAKSDLYSFGALLYELLTGKPPFTGDDPTAIISQHLNTPPVAPSWQRQDCPPGLERVILALLEKDPSKRPGDAGEVLSLLEKVDPEERSAPRSEGHVLERLARGVFVGREKELERLRKTFDEAFSGRGGLVMLVGEPGIGKTRTAQELETYARMRGAQVLWGRSHEASGAPAFWPWVQVGRGWGAGNDVNTLTPFLASGGSELVRLFPELRNVPGFSEPPALMDGAAAQFRLFDAFASFVRTISDQKPAVITLDDLHWADKPTLQLLQHLARELARMRVLVVCTYRDTDLVRTHPLSETLAELNREPGFERVVLRGLGRDEVRNYIAAAANLQPSNALVERIYEETEGNPFFLSEVVNLLTQEGTLANDSVSDIRIPDGVKEALGRRLDRISPEANTLLQVAAVVGREFTYDTLQLLHAGDDDDLLKRIEEGLEARVTEEMDQPGRYRFTHALMQETPLGELSTTRRVRLHGQVGEALEKRWGDRAEEYASRLALHFSESAVLTPEHAEKARRYALTAARQAERMFAWDDAVRRYEAAIAGQDDPDPYVLAALANCYLLAADGWDRRGARTFARAFDGFRRRGDGEGFARAVVREGILDTTTDPTVFFDRVKEALAYNPEDVATRADLLMMAANLGLNPIFQERSEPYQAALEDLLSSAAFPAADAMRLLYEVLRFGGRAGGYADAASLADAARLFHRAAEEWIALGDVPRGGMASVNATTTATTCGTLHEAEHYLASLDAWSTRFRNGMGRTMVAVSGGALALLHWDLEGVAHFTGPGIVAPGRRASDRMDLALNWRIHHLQGRPVEAIASLAPRFRGSNDVFELWHSARWSEIHLASGDEEEAEAEFTTFVELWRRVTHRIVERADSFSTAWAYLVERGEPALQAEIHEEVRHWKNFCGPWSGVGIDACRGQLALRLGLVDEAEQAFRDGAEWAERESCPIELGRNWQGLAAVAERRGDTAAALDYLDHAAGQYAPRGVQLYLDEVLAAKVRLQGLSGSDPYTSIVAVSRAVQAEQPKVADAAAPDGTVTLMFSDIEGSTALNEQLGDEKWMEILRSHNALVEEQVQQHGGRVVKTIGDGYMVVFASAEAGVRCALAIQSALGTRVSALGTPIRIRIGLHTGLAVAQGEDFFGREVNFAARVASAAIGGEVLVSEAVRERCGDGGWAFGPERGVEFKGFEGAQRVYGVTA